MAQAMMFKCVEFLGDTMDRKMIEAEIVELFFKRKGKRKEKRENKQYVNKWSKSY